MVTVLRPCINFSRPEIFMITAITTSLLRAPVFSMVLTPSRRAQLVRGKVAFVAISRVVWRWL